MRPILSLGGKNEAARVHYTGWRGGYVVARSARAAGRARAAHRRPDEFGCRRPSLDCARKAFTEGLQALGWVDGRNVQIDYRWAASKPDLFQRHAAELATLAPDVILAAGGAALPPVLQATRTIPV